MTDNLNVDRVFKRVCSLYDQCVLVIWREYISGVDRV